MLKYIQKVSMSDSSREETYGNKQHDNFKWGTQCSRKKDNAAKIVFGDPVLCAQFLKGYTDIPLFKEIKPEDIENVSSHFLPLFQESRDSDTVNKIRIGNSEIYLIALIEHQSENDFDMSFRILRYIVFIWTDYAAQQEKLHKGITKSKAFSLSTNPAYRIL